MKKEHFSFDAEILDRAQELRKQKLPWKIIAQRLECPIDSLQVTVSNRKNGKWRNARAKRERENTLIEGMVYCGLKVCDIAFLMEVSVNAVSEKLSRIGLDREMREDIWNGRV